MATTLSVPSPEIRTSETTKRTGIFQRLFGRQSLNIAILLLFPLILAQPLRQSIELLRDPDLWWHLADARNLFTSGHFVQVEPYSFTVAGERWVNPEWLSEVPYWLGYRLFHFQGIYVVTWLALAANLLFIYWRGYLRCGHMAAAFWASVLGFELMTVNSGPRTIIMAYLALSSELAILEALEHGHRKFLWLLPPLFCVWINLHGSWVIGLALFGLYCLSGLFTFQKGVFDQVARPLSENVALGKVLLASIVALIVNPYGWRLIYNPFDMMLHQQLNIASAEEWQPLNLGWLVGKCALASILLMVVANGFQSRKWKVYELAFITFAWFAAFDHARFAFLAAVITTPFLAGDLKRVFCKCANVQKTVPFFNAVLIAEACWMACHILPPATELQRDFDQLFPLQTLALVQPSWRTFNSADLGGIMAFESKPSYLDSRLDTFEHHGILSAYLDTIRMKETFENLDKYRIDHILFQDHTPFVYLLEHSSSWRVARRAGQGTEGYVLFERTGPAR